MFHSTPRLFVAGILAGSTLFALAGAAQSSTVISDNGHFTLYGSGANDLPSGLNEQKIFLVKSGASGTTSPPGGDGTLALNGTCGTPCANFSSSSVIDLANGFANIVAHDGGLYRDLKFTVPGYKFGDFLFDLQLGKADTDPLNLSITVNGTDIFNVPVADLKHNADLSFALVADASFFITSVVLNSIDANDATVGFTETKHFQVSDLQSLTGGGGQNETPIPGALWLFGSALAGAAGVGKWRRKRKSAAI